MNSRKRKKVDPCALCARLYPDDGVDPRDDKRRDAEHDKNTGRKLHQLCRQVARTLQLAFGALPQAGAFAGVFVREVIPAPNAGRLCVMLSAPDGRCRDEVAAIVQQHSGRLRAEVAEAISRRRVPELTFEVMVEGGDRE